jgi:phosphoesterase RecJ-like protein
LSDVFQAAFGLIDGAERIFMTAHVNPDGDAIGSLLALALALRAKGKPVTVGMQDPTPASCAFLPGAETIVPPPVSGDFDLAIVLDCENPGRAGSLESVVLNCPKILAIDHHPSNRSFGDAEIRDTSAAATGEILYDFLLSGGYVIPPDIAECLMAAIMLDTGGFRYSNTSPKTLRTAAALREIGADIPGIYRQLFEDRPGGSVKLMGIALSRLEAAAGGRIHFAYLTQGDFKLAGAGENETDGINSQLIGILGTEASALFRESASGGVRVSLRSREWLDVNRVARVFGGGGHVRASGCTVQAPLPDAIRQVIAEMESQLDRKPED